IWDLSLTTSRPILLLGESDFRDTWACLDGKNGANAYDAMSRLIHWKTDAVRLIATQLKPITPVSDEQLRQLVADLGSSRFATRESASRQLSELGDRALPALRSAKNGPLSQEAQWRVERLLNRRFVPLSLETARFLRAVEVLERIGTPEARQLLVKLSEG